MQQSPREELEELRARARLADLDARAARSTTSDGPVEQASASPTVRQQVGSLPPVSMADPISMGLSLGTQAMRRIGSLTSRGASPMQGRRDQLAQQGTAFGFGDELDATTNAAAQPWRAGEAWQDQMGASNQQLSETRSAMPVTSLGIEAGGGIGSGGVAGGAMRAAAPRLAQGAGAFSQAHPYMTASGVGAASGGQMGFAESQGGLGSRLTGMRNGAIVGGIAAPAARFGLDMLGRGARGIFDAVTGPPPTARRAGISADDIRNLPEMPGEEFLAERASNRRARSSLVGLAGRGDDASNKITDALSARADSRGERLASATQELTGARSGTQNLLDVQEIQNAARPLFNAADDTQGVMTPRMREAIRFADRAGVTFRDADNLAARSQQPRVQLSAYADDIDNLPGQARLGDIRALARTVEERQRQLIRRGEDPGDLWQIARSLRDEIADQSPEYRQAASMWRSSARDEEAQALGARIFQNGAPVERDMVNFASGTASESERRSFLAGVADAMQAKTDSAALGADASARLRREGIQRRLRIVLGDEATDRMMQNAGRESAMAHTERLGLGRGVSDTRYLQDADRAAARVTTGRGRQFAGDAVQDLSGALGIRDRVANAVRGDNPEAAMEAARLLLARSRNDPAALSALEGLSRDLTVPQIGGVPAGYGGGLFGSRRGATRPR